MGHQWQVWLCSLQLFCMLLWKRANNLSQKTQPSSMKRNDPELNTMTLSIPWAWIKVRHGIFSCLVQLSTFSLRCFLDRNFSMSIMILISNTWYLRFNIGSLVSRTWSLISSKMLSIYNLANKLLLSLLWFFFLSHGQSRNFVKIYQVISERNVLKRQFTPVTFCTVIYWQLPWWCLSKWVWPP